jgi:hypothetical protein
MFFLKGGVVELEHIRQGIIAANGDIVAEVSVPIRGLRQPARFNVEFVRDNTWVRLDLIFARLRDFANVERIKFFAGETGTGGPSLQVDITVDGDAAQIIYKLSGPFTLEEQLAFQSPKRGRSIPLLSRG